MKKVYLAGICVFLMVVSIGCSTIKGVGEDISSVGGWVSKGSDNVKEGK